jgi:hypothetical protein
MNHEAKRSHLARRPRSGHNISVKVIKRHRCAGFVRLYDDVAFYLPNDRHAEQAVEQEPLVVSEVWHHDLQKVVGFARYKMERDYLWHGAYGRHEVVGALARMPLNLDADKYRHAQANPIAAEQGAIALDDAFLFQALDTPQAWRR